MFFATSAIESLRSALNVAYRVKERRTYVECVIESAFIVVLSAACMLVLAWGIVVGPQVAARFKPTWLLGWPTIHGSRSITRYSIVTAGVSAQLMAYHLWLAAGRRRLADVWPGVLLSVVLLILVAQLFAKWLTISDYTRFYAGLASIMSALVFFQASSIIVILGAELNRGIMEMKRKLAIAHDLIDATGMAAPQPVLNTATAPEKANGAADEAAGPFNREFAREDTRSP